ncbi:UDP-N-acetylmuramate--L-alanine ligase [Waddlia chondrophila 2032/99]|uniref:UDP-N-acetylmuramate--L-alanine ligase n=2 Tax=Waddlia chondrophila TaxID=71667 RepID=D6YRP1_WADCW|nr:UDP-N-acetylmuramate--L-alanine ligase [Waddlia chondrophila]ADI38736.1 UDP-N-acetylmuramate--alanine ligase [Waddlia chondrophila WSU 86-1044]CCB91069.1 UDP-N-acetylmuramate--L-alanine ligase [Waddlia chondrophila 2032/99]
MKRAFHFIGIGGIGMSSLARILLEKGEVVSGSDLAATSMTESLCSLGAKISLGQKAENISPAQTVVFSTDIKESNPEFQAAVKLRCEMQHRCGCLLNLMKNKDVLAVGGTHGKTTSSSLLAWVLEVCGFSPSFAIGGIVANFKANGKAGEGSCFVAEADESDGTLARYRSFGAIVTNIGLDHMDHHQTEERLLNCFRTFFSKVQNEAFCFWCGDDKRLQTLNPKGVSYGFHENNRLRVDHFRQVGWTSIFDVVFDGKRFADIEVLLAGEHHALNAAAVFGLSLRLGAQESKIREALKTFKGVARRCEVKGEKNGILFLDDYAHHPTEIRATLKAIRQASPDRRIVAVFQPHRYTRTRDCMGMYGSTFHSADQVIVTDIHAAGESPIPGVEVCHILSELEKNSSVKCRYLPREDLSCKLSKFLEKGDVVVTLGAGNITKVAVETLEAF